jgi:uncharacterized protein YjbJ (UPF0337 family)
LQAQGQAVIGAAERSGTPGKGVVNRARHIIAGPAIPAACATATSGPTAQQGPTINWHWNCLRAERRSNTMKESTKDQAKGKVHEVKGTAKEKIGRATNNPNLKAEGQDEKTSGKIQKKIGQVEKVAGA